VPAVSKSPGRRVHVAIDTGTDPHFHEEAFERDLVADRLPYGLQHLEEHGFALSWLPKRGRGLMTRVLAEAGRRATLDLNPWSLVEGPGGRRRADVVLAWEERVGLPVAAGRALGEPPCVTGLIWLTDRADDLPRLYRRAMSAALARAAAVFVLSSAQVAPLVESWGVDSERLHYVPFGVPTELWGRGSETEQDAALVVSAGNDWARDHALLVEAVSQVQRWNLPLRLELLTERQVPVHAALGVRRLGKGAADVRAAYGRASFVAVATRPNLHASGMTVALEAMAVGRAVVASATPGMEDYVVDGETGLLVTPGDKAALADAMATLLRDPDLAARLGAAGKARVRARFTSARMVADLAVLLNAATS
jgi:glycosyltransferase involved in cell wall biosynthesis